MPDLLPFDAITSTDAPAVGGKAFGLAQLARAGLPVPPGFCLTADAYHRLHDTGLVSDTTLSAAIVAAYRRLGGPVAVRSSATAEDGRTASFAGQQETILGVEGEPALFAAIARCWVSLDSDRARAYRQQQGVSEEAPAMAVVVQRMVAAEVAGVLFTRDPQDATGQSMLAEASWGLGASVVAGRVSPDCFQLDRVTGSVLDRQLGSKAMQVTAAGEQPVPAERQAIFCLDDEHLRMLAELGRKVEALDGEPRDVEWAWAGGQFWLLQARPITAPGAAEREQVRQEEIARLRDLADPAGTVWGRHNLAEVLAAPTPMTWAVLQRLLSGTGGFGRMYRDFGYAPASELAAVGVYDLIAGRPYCNLSREVGMQYHGLPYAHSFINLKARPETASCARPAFSAARAGASFWLRLPLIVWRLARASARTRALARTFEARFRQEVLPAYLRDVEAEASVDLTRLSEEQLLRRFDAWCERVLGEFARDSLKPTALADAEMARREQSPGSERPVAAELAARPDPDADLPAAFADLAAFRLSRAAFRERFGHRGPQEMELAQPRWAERPDFDPTSGIATTAVPTLGALTQPRSPETERLRTFLGLRETAKHHFMRGYASIRRILLELDRRHGLNGGIFFLTPEELPRLVAREDLVALIAQRIRRRTIALSLEAPAVLFSDDLEALGRPPAPVEGAATLTGVPLSAGVAEGPALVLCEPIPPSGEGYILVCPSTDPAWVPLFVPACGLVMETGGVLSHGAIVAREFGRPAVAGVADATRRLRTGQRLRVDGSTGVVTVLDDI